MIYRDLALVHPKAIAAFTAMAHELANMHQSKTIEVLFRPFESYRDPDRQDDLLSQGTTKAAAWHSAHQYGLAVDFVPYVEGVWNWGGATSEQWEVMHAVAEKHGLSAPITWDKAHIEHPLWKSFRRYLK